jgi:two-component system response regulator YesN
MYKALIVDDEDYFREGFRYIIPWQDYGVTIVGDASNGEQALELIKKEKPHLLFLDIQMPSMNGLELLRQLQLVELTPKIIIISGYDDFAYVKDAMQYKVENYLLKPLEQEELIRTLNQTIEKLEYDAFSQIKERQGFTIIKHNTLSRMLNNGINFRELREKTEFLDVDIYGKQQYIAVTHLEMPLLYNEHDCQLLNYAVLNISEEILEGFNVTIFPDYEGRTIIIWNSSDAYTPYTSQFIHERLHEVISSIKAYLKVNAWIALSQEALSYKGLPEVYKEAVNTLEYRFLLNDRHILDVTEINTDRINRTGFPAIEYHLIETWLHSGKIEQLEDYIHELVTNLQQIKPTLDGARTLLLELIVNIYSITRQSGKDLTSIKDHYEKFMQDLVVEELDLNRVERDLRDFILKVIQLFDATKPPYSKLVNDMINYIEHHLEKEISLKTLSHVIDANPAYLGRMFFMGTGETFSDYLNKVRIGKSKALLDESHLKIQDISERVGFSNPTYFHTIFKRVVGVTPSEFRERFKSRG